MALFVIVFDVVDRPEMLFLLDEAAALPVPKVALAIVGTVVCVAFLLAAGRLSSSGLRLWRIMSLVLRAISGMRGSLETRNVGSTRSTVKGGEAVRHLGFCAFISFRERDRWGSDDLWYQWLDVEVLRLRFFGVGISSSLSLRSGTMV